MKICWFRHGKRVKSLGDTPITKGSYENLKKKAAEIYKSGNFDSVKVFYAPNQRAKETYEAFVEGIGNVQGEAADALEDIKLTPEYKNSIEFDKEGDKIPGWQMIKTLLAEKNLKAKNCETVEELMARHIIFYKGVLEKYGNLNVLVLAIGCEPGMTLLFRKLLKENNIKNNPLGEELLPREGFFELVIEKKALKSIAVPDLNFKVKI